MKAKEERNSLEVLGCLPQIQFPKLNFDQSLDQPFQAKSEVICKIGEVGIHLILEEVGREGEKIVPNGR